MAASGNRKTSTKSNSGRTNNASRNRTSNTKNTSTRSRASQNNSRRDNDRQRRSRDDYYEREPLDENIKNEITLIVVIALCIVLFLCNFHLIGVFGNAVSSFMFGVFGIISYILPIGIIVFTLFRVFNRNNSVVTRKLIAAVVLVLLIITICELATGLVSRETLGFVELYKRCSTDRKGGGIIGGIIAFYCVKLLGSAGTWVLIIVLACICVIIISGKAILSGLKEQGQLMYDDSREERRYRKEQNHQRNEEKIKRKQEKIAAKREINDELERERRLKREEKENEKILRMDMKMNGVSRDTTLKREISKDDDILDDIKDDQHRINVTDSEEYKENINNSAAVHTANTSDGSDATREVTFDDYNDYYEPETESQNSNQNDNFDTTSSDYEVNSSDAETYQAPIHMNGKTYGADPAAYGAGGAKPEASYAKEYGNTMGRTSKKDRPSASRASTNDTKTEQTKPVRAKNPSAVYRFPPIELLTKAKNSNQSNGEKELRETADKLQKTLEVFGVSVKITDISRGPAVTRYEMQPELGVKVSKIVGLADDLKLALAATDIRIEAPIPGKSAVGIEVPNKENEAVSFRELVESKEFKASNASLPFAVGKDLAGQIIVHDIAKMPHVLIAGATGSGKSVCINTIIMSILYKCKPEDVKLIMIDPKVVELSVYNGIPHLLLPVVTDPKKAAGALGWAVREMTDRYAKFADTGVRDLKGYNAQISDESEKLPHILIIVDELADLMMVAPGEVEEHICRLAQLARACGIHVVIATQRPSVDVITGLIKANMPSRIAFAVSSGVDSRTILDMVGAEKLLGKGDMLFYPQGLPKPSRVQGAFVPDSDVGKVVSFLKELAYVPSNDQDIEEQVSANAINGSNGDRTGSGGGNSDFDEYFAEAGRFIIDKEKASIGALQRLLKIGFNRAARIMDQLAAEGVVGEEAGTKPREILMTVEQFEELLENLGL